MINSFKLPNSTTGENPLYFAKPEPEDDGVIVVVCGPNGAGKSHVLKVLKEVIDGKKVGKIHAKRGWSVELSSQDSRVYRPEDHFSHMNSIGTLSKEKAQKKPRPNDIHLRLNISIFEDVLRSAEGLPPSISLQVGQISEDAGSLENEAKLSFLKDFEEEDARAYWITPDQGTFLEFFSSLIGCRIGLTWDSGYFQLAFAFGDGTSSLYSNLSDGQKSLFLLLASVHYHRPDILIFDELENFLHPQMMTRILAYLKDRVRQTIMTTHHPHVIFGRHVDQIFLMERTDLGQNQYPTVVKEFKQQPNPPRRVTSLTSENEKLAGLYRLFDMKDSALLASARFVDRQADLTVLNAAHSAFSCMPAPVGGKGLPDRQTVQIFEQLNDFYVSGSPVLDWGAGLGRVYSELMKLGAASATTNCSWFMYEPEPTDQLKALATKDSNIELMTNVNEAMSFQGGLMLATNVLHILPHQGWHDFIRTCRTVLGSTPSCRLLISEIYPLLSPEQNALPIPENHLLQLLRSCGLDAYAKRFTVFESSAYCVVVALDSDSDLSNGQIDSNLRTFYFDLLNEYKSTYKAVPGGHSQSTRNELLNAAFGLATASLRLDQMPG